MIRSPDSGLSWGYVSQDLRFRAFALSSDGNKLVGILEASPNRPIYASTDAGLDNGKPYGSLALLLAFSTGGIPPFSFKGPHGALYQVLGNGRGPLCRHQLMAPSSQLPLTMTKLVGFSFPVIQVGKPSSSWQTKWIVMDLKHWMGDEGKKNNPGNLLKANIWRPGLVMVVVVAVVV